MMSYRVILLIGIIISACVVLGFIFILKSMADRNTREQNAIDEYTMYGWIVSRASDGKYLYSSSSGDAWYACGSQPSGYTIKLYDPGWSIAWTVSAGNTAYFHAQWKYNSTEEKIAERLKQLKSLDGKYFTTNEKYHCALPENTCYVGCPCYNVNVIKKMVVLYL